MVVLQHHHFISCNGLCQWEFTGIVMYGGLVYNVVDVRQFLFFTGVAAHLDAIVDDLIGSADSFANDL
jgi:hypothetical protein